MASEWELGMAVAAPYLYGLPSADTLRIDDLLDFSCHDAYSSSSSAGSHVDTNSRSRCFADEIYVPSEEAAELEWLSKFVEDSDAPFATSYLPTGPQALSGPAPDPPACGARSRRSRVASSSDFSQPAHISGSGSGGGRRCAHCAAEKTPQWRTGPAGPKTLCNACGVRYKSGRLVPEYRPAASPTFVMTRHSNSHRKVTELRRQNERALFPRHQDSSNYSSAPAAVAIAVRASSVDVIYHN